MNTTFVPRIVAELPDGWAALETAEFYGPGGVRLRVTGERVEEGLDTAGFARRHGAALVEGVGGYREVDLRDVTSFAGVTAVRRDVTFGDDDAGFRGVAIYLVRDGIGYIASATSLAEEFASIEDDVMMVAGRLTILGLPSGVTQAVAPDGRPAENRRGQVRPPLAAADWADLRSGWSHSIAAPHDEASAGLAFSAEECAVVAAMLGAKRFPTVAPQTIAGLPEAQRAGVGNSLVRSMMTRGVLVTGGGLIKPTAEAANLLDIALYPDLLVEIALTAGGRTGQAAFGVRPDSMVAITDEGDFGRRITPAEPSDLVERIVEFAGIDAVAPGVGPERSMAVDEVERWVWVRSAWREGSSLIGGELRWAVVDGALFEADFDPAGLRTDVVLRESSSEMFRSALLLHLPGAG